MGPEYTLHPTWWNDQHNTAWERMREALKRDWEQTKSDLTGHARGHDLHQGIGDTVRQATGRDPLPPPSTRTPHESWERAEGAVRYGHGAGVYYGRHREWDDELEGTLRREWGDLKSGRDWDDARPDVRRGWDAARRQD